MTIDQLHLDDKNVVTMHAFLYTKEVEIGISTENQCLTVYGNSGAYSGALFRENIPVPNIKVDDDALRIGSKWVRVNTSMYDTREEAIALLNVIAMMAGDESPASPGRGSEQGDVEPDPAQPASSDAPDDWSSSPPVDEIVLPEPEPDSGPLPSGVAQSKRLTDASWELAQWAIAHRVEDDPYVDALTSTIDNRGNLTAFAATNPLDLLPVPDAKAGSLLSSVARIVTVTRNVLVFAPVLITWWAISEATRAYGRYVDALRQRGSDESTSFLEFWESGGVGIINPPLPKFWRITDVAIKDALIIAVIILLTFVAGLLESIAKGRRERAEAKIDKDRTRIAVATMVALQGNKSVDTESLTDALAIALADLGQAARDVNIAAERMEAASVGVSALTPRVAELSGNVSTLSEQFSSDVQVSIQALIAAVSTLGNTLEGDLQRFMSEVLTGLEEVTERLKTTSVGVEFGTKQLRDDLDAIHARLQGLLNSR